MIFNSLVTYINHHSFEIISNNHLHALEHCQSLFINVANFLKSSMCSGSNSNFLESTNEIVYVNFVIWFNDY